MNTTMSGMNSNIGNYSTSNTIGSNSGNNIVELINLYGKIPDLISSIAYYLDSWGNLSGNNAPSDINEGSPEYMIYKYFGNTLLLLISLLEHYDPKYPNNLQILKIAVSKYPITGSTIESSNNSNRSIWFIRWYYQLLHNHFSISSTLYNPNSNSSSPFHSLLTIGKNAGRELIKILFHQQDSDILGSALGVDFTSEHNSTLDKDMAIKSLLSQYSPWELMEGVHYLIDQMTLLLQHSSKTHTKKGMKIDSKKIIEIIESLTRHVPFFLLLFLEKFSLSLDFLISSFASVANSSTGSNTGINTSTSILSNPEHEKEKIWLFEQFVEIFNSLIHSSTSTSNITNLQSHHNSSSFSFPSSSPPSQTIEESVVMLVSSRIVALLSQCLNAVNSKSISIPSSILSQFISKLDHSISLLHRFSPASNTSSTTSSNPTSSIPFPTPTSNPSSSSTAISSNGGANIGYLSGLSSGPGGTGVSGGGGGGYMNSIVHKNFTNLVRDSLNGGIKEKEIENSLLAFHSLSLSAGVHKLVSLITKEVLASMNSPTLSSPVSLSNISSTSQDSSKNYVHNESGSFPFLTKQSLRAAEIGGCIIGSCGIAIVSHLVSNILPMYIPHLVSPSGTHNTHHYGVAHSQLLAYLTIVALTTAKIDIFPCTDKLDLLLHQQESQIDFKAKRKLRNSIIQLVSNLLLPSTSFPACSPSVSFPLSFLSLASFMSCGWE